ncbi:MAG: class I adenylate-forming enzyme family protein [Betaproteobacteria bacterium]
MNHIHRWANAHPEKLALIYEDTPISYANFARKIDAACAFFKKHELPAGHIAILLVANLLDGWTLGLALRALGLTTISVQSIGQAEALNLTGVACVVVTARERQFHRLEGKSMEGARVIIVEHLADSDAAAGAAARMEISVFGDHIMYTSGTTGTYKKVLIDGARDEARYDWWIRSFSYDDKTVFHIHKFGLWTAAGFGYPCAVWQAGGCVIFDQRQDHLKSLFRHGVTHTFLVPSMVKAVLASQRTEPRQNFEVAVAGGFLSLNLAQEVVRRLTNSLKIVYGASECIAMLRSSFESVDDLFWLVPYDGRVIQVVDDKGNELPCGSEGFLRIAMNFSDATEYLDDITTTKKYFVGGFFYPGDMAVKRTDGRFRILGRVDDVLNVRGHKIAVAPIEDAIQRHLQVDAVCVFSGLNADGIDVLVVTIESKHQVPREKLAGIGSLNAFAPAATAFGNFQCLRFKAFPRTTNGMNKIKRAELNKQAFSLLRANQLARP